MLHVAIGSSGRFAFCIEPETALEIDAGMVQGIQQACLQAVQLSCARIADNKLRVTTVRMESVLAAALAYLDTSNVSP